MELSTPTSYRVSAQRADFYHRVLEQIQHVQGVESAGIIGDLFIGNAREQVVTVERPDRAVSARLLFRRDEVSADFFSAIGTPLLRGRFLSSGDGPDKPLVAIINDAMSRTLWPGRNPVGARFRLGPNDAGSPWYNVVGVVEDMRRQGPEHEPGPQMFVSLAQNPPRNADLFIRTTSDHPLGVATTLRAAVHGVEKDAAVYGVAPLEQQLGAYLTDVASRPYS